MGFNSQDVLWTVINRWGVSVISSAVICRYAIWFYMTKTNYNSCWCWFLAKMQSKRSLYFHYTVITVRTIINRMLNSWYLTLTGAPLKLRSACNVWCLCLYKFVHPTSFRSFSLSLHTQFFLLSLDGVAYAIFSILLHNYIPTGYIDLISVKQRKIEVHFRLLFCGHAPPLGALASWHV